jgi:hypothetical protein
MYDIERVRLSVQQRLTTVAETEAGPWCNAIENMYSKAFRAIDSDYSILNQVSPMFYTIGA